MVLFTSTSKYWQCSGNKCLGQTEWNNCIYSYLRTRYWTLQHAVCGSAWARDSWQAAAGTRPLSLQCSEFTTDWRLSLSHLTCFQDRQGTRQGRVIHSNWIMADVTHSYLFNYLFHLFYFYAKKLCFCFKLLFWKIKINALAPEILLDTHA